jgi:hypothetical protein
MPCRACAGVSLRDGGSQEVVVAIHTRRRRALGQCCLLACALTFSRVATARTEKCFLAVFARLVGCSRSIPARRAAWVLLAVWGRKRREQFNGQSLQKPDNQLRTAEH